MYESAQYDEENINGTILTLEEAATYLKISTADFKKILDKYPGNLMYLKVNEEYVFTTKNLNAWLEMTRVIIND